MTFHPADFNTAEPQTNWIQLLLKGASSLSRRPRVTSVSRLSPRMLDDIGYISNHYDPAPRRRR